MVFHERYTSFVKQWLIEIDSNTAKLIVDVPQSIVPPRPAGSPRIHRCPTLDILMDMFRNHLTLKLPVNERQA